MSDYRLVPAYPQYVGVWLVWLVFVSAFVGVRSSFANRAVFCRVVFYVLFTAVAPYVVFVVLVVGFAVVRLVVYRVKVVVRLVVRQTLLYPLWVVGCRRLKRLGSAFVGNVACGFGLTFVNVVLLRVFFVERFVRKGGIF